MSAFINHKAEQMLCNLEISLYCLIEDIISFYEGNKNISRGQCVCVFCMQCQIKFNTYYWVKHHTFVSLLQAEEILQKLFLWTPFTEATMSTTYVTLQQWTIEWLSGMFFDFADGYYNTAQTFLTGILTALFLQTRTWSLSLCKSDQCYVSENAWKSLHGVPE